MVSDSSRAGCVGGVFERVEVVPGRIDLWPRHNSVAEGHEDVGDFLEGLGDEMMPTPPELAGRKGYVDPVFEEERIFGNQLEFVSPRGYQSAQLLARFMQLRTNRRTLFRGQSTERTARFGDQRFSAEEFVFEVFECVEIGCRSNPVGGSCEQSCELVHRSGRLVGTALVFGGLGQLIGKQGSGNGSVQALGEAGHRDRDPNVRLRDDLGRKPGTFVANQNGA